MRGRARSSSLEFWYRRRFNLAPTDPRFLNATEEDLLVEYYAWYYHENPTKDEVEDDDFDLEAVKRAMENGDDWETVSGAGS